MQYRDLHEVLKMDTEIRVHDAAAKLIHQIAFAETRKALDGLKTAGVIGEALAVTLALELNEALIRPHRKDEPSQGNVARMLDPDKSYIFPHHESTLEKPEAELVLDDSGGSEVAPSTPAPKARRKRGSPPPVRFCPVCQEMGIQTALTPGAVGCVAHWREVKRRKNV